MAPESSSNAGSASSASIRQNVSVPAPGAGSDISVLSSAGGQLQLGFDPSEATTTRSGNDLTFEVDGGSVTVKDFFVVGDESLPSLRLPDGTVVASNDFFAGSSFDLTTAAGPGGGGGGGSGSGEYRDDAGNLIGGIDRFGKLGTDFWGRGVERPETYVHREEPGGEFGLSGNSYDMNGMFVSSGMYEDWRPDQNTGDYDTKLLGKLDFSCAPSGTTVVDSIHLSGFTPGTIIVIGTPQFDANGNLINGIVVTSPNQVFDFTQDNFAKDGVYVMPPPNSDKDMNINVSIDIHAESSGVTGTVNGNFTIIVDAVADQPFVKDAAFDDMHLTGHVDIGRGETSEGFDGKGSYVVEQQMDGTERVSVKVPFETTVKFGDYEDSSESHYVLIEVPSQPVGAEWTCTDANGNPVDIITGPDGKSYFQVPVSNEDIAAGNGEVTVNVELTVTGDSATVTDTDMNLNVGGMAVENPDDEELRLDNNVSYDWKEGGADLNLDVLDGGLKITAGWASEGNNDAKHVGGGSGDYAYGGVEGGATGNEAGSKVNIGAPIVIESGVDSHGSAETLTRVEFTYDASEGHLWGYDAGGNLVDLDPGGTGRVVLDNVNSGRVDVYYRPNDGSFSDKDVNVNYQVDVKNEAGVSGSYSGGLAVVVDAVADKPINTGATGPGYAYDGEDGYSAATAGTIISFEVRAEFPDTQGSENHFLLVQVPPAGSHLILCDADGNPITYDTVVINGETYYKIPVPGEQSPVSSNVHFKVDENRGDAQDGSYQIKTGALAEVQEDGGRMDNEYDYANNQAVTINPPITIDVDYMDSSGEGSASSMYEDNQPKQNLGIYTEGSASDGNLNIHLNNDGDRDTVMTGEVEIRFTYDGDSDSLHFTINGHDYYAERVPGSNDFVLKVPAAEFDGRGPGTDGVLQYHPPANDDHDLNNIRFESDVKNNATGEKGHVGGSASDMIVDAVADKPVDVHAGDNGVSYVGSDGQAHDSAAWGSDVTFNVTVTFKDVADGSEKHYVLIEHKPGMTGNYDTITGPDGKSYYMVDVNEGIEHAMASAGGSYPHTYTENGVSYTVTLGADGQPQVTVSMDVTLTLPEDGNHNYMNQDGSISLGAGGLAVEGDLVVKGPSTGNGHHDHGISKGGSDSELTKDNNTSMTLDDVEIKVNVVTSKPTVSIENNHIYENLTPDAHKGDDTMSDGATIKVGGLAAGEVADITFYFDFAGPDSAGSGAFSPVPGHEDDAMRLEVYGPDGELLGSYEVTWDADSGRWSCTVPVDAAMQGPDGNVTIVFKPGHNDNSADIKIDYDIKVTDPASGDGHEWNSGDPNLPSLGVVVDAVAQQPDVQDVDANYQGTGGTDAFVSGGKVDIGLKIEFHDFTDGSELHFVLVEAQVGWQPPSSTLIIYDANGVAHEVPVTWSMQMIDGTMYYKAEIDNEYIQQWGQGQNGGVLDVHVEMQSPAGANGHINISAGGGSWENKDVVDGELRWDNNTAFDFKDVDMNFSAAGDFGLRPGGPVYENDTPDANVGDDAHAGGTTLTVVTSHGDDVVTDFKFDNYDPSKGKIYYKDPNTGNLVEINPDGTIPGNPPLHGGDQFVFVPGENYSDKDVNLSYTGTITDPHSGDSKTPSHDSTIAVDAVAQLPGDISSAGGDIVWPSGTSEKPSFTVKVTATFQDYEDGSEQHYVLVEALPNMSVPDAVGTFTVRNPDGTYTTYYKVPVSNDDIRSGNGTVEVEVKIVVEGQLSSGNPDSMKVGALAEEPVSNITDGEIRYDNNYAFAESDPVSVGPWPGGPGDGLWVDVAYENDRPNSHLGDETPAGGALIHFGDGAASADVIWDGSRGYIVDANGNEYRGGNAHLEGADGPFKFVSEGHGDGDLSVDYTTYGPDGSSLSGGSALIVVDAVANKPGDLDTSVDYGQRSDGSDYGAMGKHDGHGNDGSVIVHVTGSFADSDGSETHYALVEAQPGWAVPGAEMVYLEGKAYWRVEMAKGSDGKYLTDANGKEYADVKVEVSNPGLVGSGGHNLGTGIMAEEKESGHAGNLEGTLDNNVSWTLDGNAHIETSFVDSSVSVSVPGGFYERGEDQPGFEVKISGTLGENDVFNGMTIKGSGGVFSVDDPDGVGGWHIDGNGNLVIDDWNAIGKITVTFTPGAHSDQDVHFEWNANFTDSKSGDSQGYGGAPTTVVDAVANAPDIKDQNFTSDSGHEAALATEGGNVNITLHFDDLDSSEIHYAVLEQGGVWMCDKVTINGVEYPVITIFDNNGNPYYAVQIPDSVLRDGNGDVNISWHVTAPDAASDVDDSVKTGGISVETSTGADGDRELSLGNNWAENVQDVPVHLGVFETDSVGLGSHGKPTETGEGGARLALQAPADGTHEIITETDLVFTQAGAKSGDVIGTVWYNGQAYPVVIGQDGKAHVTIDFRPNGYDSNAEFRFVTTDENGVPLNNHNSSSVHVVSDSTVQDVRTGEEHDFRGSTTINVQGVADAPTDVEAKGPSDAVGSGHGVTVTVSAHFDDVDGSERHYVLVEAKPGWTCNDPHSVWTDPDTGTRYFRVEVDGRAGDVNKDVSLTAPKDYVLGDRTESLGTGALAEEKAAGSDNAHGFTPGGDVTVDISNGATLFLANSNPAEGVVEGGDMVFTLTLANASGQFFSADVDMTVTLRLSWNGASAEDLNLAGWRGPLPPDDAYEYDLTLPKGSSEVDIHVPVANDGLIEGSEGVHIEIVGSDVPAAISGNVVVDDSPHDVTIIDADYAAAAGHGIGNEAIGMELHHVGAGHDYDGSGDSRGSVVLGTDGDDIIRGSDHGDILHGGGGNDIFYGGAGNDTIYAGTGDNVIRGGGGDDVLHSGPGRDTFLWLADDFGNAGAPAQDIIHDFKLNHDVICFKDVFGAEGSLDGLLGSAGFDSNSRTVSLAAENGSSLQAEFLNESQLMLTLKDDGGNTVQTITVNAADGTTFLDDSGGMNDEGARELLKQMIKDGLS
ncbi:MAG: hypothetical protein LBD42_02150 [Desulfovibrio sp.]|jgi:hypothetical protein|nr:hypothetical protein [Desulfovibrio sp.]